MARKQVQRPKPARAAARRIGIFIFDGVTALDAVGPADVFGMANLMSGEEEPGSPPQYDVRFVAPRKGPVRTVTGFSLAADYGMADAARLDALIIPGAYDQRAVDTLFRNAAHVAWLKRASQQSRRVASVCTGALILARLGLLKGKRATTHWRFSGQLRAGYPQITVEPDRLWIKDGKIYTSAGITSGMDLALALVEEDLGRRFALELARILVMFLKRPGGQSQFSSELIAQLAAPDRLEDMVDWMRGHLDRPLTIETLAERSGMSARNFQRVFTRQCGMPAAKFIEKLRVERARLLIEDTGLAMAEIARKCGFDDEQRMRRAFRRTVGITPSDHAARVRPA